jgi:putative transposase
MARIPRIDSIGYYHVLNRGVEKRAIFLEDLDYFYFLSLLDELRELYRFQLHAYCLMNNHYHLLIETTDENLSLILKQLNHRYTLYFNKKYNRVGTLWQGRFKSWYVHDDHYLETLTKYIEYNPIKAGITSMVGEYTWASSVSKEAPFISEDDQILKQYQNDKITIKDNEIVKHRSRSLESYFVDDERNSAIIKALADGYRQTQIARYCSLSDVAVSKIVKIETDKRKLFQKLKTKGIFWSYSDQTSFLGIDSDTMIEHTLKYADYDDIVELFKLYGKRFIFRVWEKVLKNDLRFKKLNLFLARVFFGMDVQANYFMGGMNEREKKLRLLAS